jgi:hypothetical protein
MLTGGVGTGKTMLMDVFYDALSPGVRKKRIHFHDFLLDVHRALRQLTSVADPLVAVAEARRAVSNVLRAACCSRVHHTLCRSSRACTSPAAGAWCSAWTSLW